MSLGVTFAPPQFDLVLVGVWRDYYRRVKNS